MEAESSNLGSRHDLKSLELKRSCSREDSKRNQHPVSTSQTRQAWGALVDSEKVLKPGRSFRLCLPNCLCDFVRMR